MWNPLNISTYSLKPRFQRLLIPMRNWLVRYRFSANQITLLGCFLSMGYAGLLFWSTQTYILLLFLPVFLIIRMALNALDGMIATATKSQSAMGSVLNEVCDIISDLALFGAFSILLPVPVWLWLVLIIFCLLSEFIALAVFQAIGSRPFSGPFGKSDRALYLGLLALLLVFLPQAGFLYYAYIIIGITLSVITIWSRLRLVYKGAS